MNKQFSIGFAIALVIGLVVGGAWAKYGNPLDNTEQFVRGPGYENRLVNDADMVNRHRVQESGRSGGQCDQNDGAGQCSGKLNGMNQGRGNENGRGNGSGAGLGNGRNRGNTSHQSSLMVSHRAGRGSGEQIGNGGRGRNGRNVTARCSSESSCRGHGGDLDAGESCKSNGMAQMGLKTTQHGCEESTCNGESGRCENEREHAVDDSESQVAEQHPRGPGLGLGLGLGRGFGRGLGENHAGEEVDSRHHRRSSEIATDHEE